MSDLTDSLERLQADALAELATAGDAAAVEALRASLFGRSGRLTQLLRGLGAFGGCGGVFVRWRFDRPGIRGFGSLSELDVGDLPGLCQIHLRNALSPDVRHE